VHSPITSTDDGSEEDQDVFFEEASASVLQEPSTELDENFEEPGSGEKQTEINTSNGTTHEESTELTTSSEIQESVTPPESSSTDVKEEAVLSMPPDPIEEEILPAANINPHNNNNNREIEQESIKQTLHDIISEIDREMEADNFNEEVCFLKRSMKPLLILPK